MSPKTQMLYSGGALITSQLADVIGAIFPHLSQTVASSSAALLLTCIGVVHAFVSWYIKWKWPETSQVSLVSNSLEEQRTR